jgi:hypothetical protein
MTKPYCPGTNCPLAGSCARYKPNINVKKEIHFAEVPYNHRQNLCNFFIKDGEADKLSKRITEIEKENGNPN